LPHPTSTEAPHFDGHDVTDFLVDIEKLFRRYIIPQNKWFDEVVTYYDKRIGRFLCTTDAWKNRDWEAFKEFLRGEYEEGDESQRIDTRENLERLKSESRNNDSTAQIRDYCRDFSAISSTLMSSGDLDGAT